MNKFDLMIEATAEASATMRAADMMANKMAALIKNRLRNVSPNHLKVMKRELRNFNIQTGEWK